MEGRFLLAAGLTLTRDINLTTAENHSDPDDFERVGGAVYFLADTPTQRGMLWRTNGTSAGTVSFGASALKGGTPRELTNVGGVLFFAVRRFVDEERVEELWRSDGTTSGTVRLKAFVSGNYYCQSTGLTD
jgi:ELWxxDGT repeat protein